MYKHLILSREKREGGDLKMGSIPYIEYKLVANNPLHPLIVSAEFVIVINGWIAL